MTKRVVITLVWSHISNKYMWISREAKCLVFEPLHEISNNVVCGTSKGSDQPAHMGSLIRAFAIVTLIFYECKATARSFEPVHEISNNMVCATSKGSDQPVHTRSLIRAFASCLNIL